MIFNLPIFFRFHKLWQNSYVKLYRSLEFHFNFVSISIFFDRSQSQKILANKCWIAAGFSFNRLRLTEWVCKSAQEISIHGNHSWQALTILASKPFHVFARICTFWGCREIVFMSFVNIVWIVRRFSSAGHSNYMYLNNGYTPFKYLLGYKRTRFWEYGMDIFCQVYLFWYFWALSAWRNSRNS